MIRIRRLFVRRYDLVATTAALAQAAKSIPSPHPSVRARVLAGLTEEQK
jgi:hypothetical protein